MHEFLSVVIGAALMWVITYMLSKSGAVGKQLIKLLSLVIKNEALQNKISNEIGVLAIKAGVSIVEATPDNARVEQIVKKIKALIGELEKEVKG